MAKNKMKILNSSDVLSPIFYPVFKWLLADEQFKDLSNDSKLLYGILNSYYSLAIKLEQVEKEDLVLDDGTKINKDSVYMNLSNNHIMSLFNCADQKARKLKKELIDFGLLIECPIAGSVPKVYLLEPAYDIGNKELTDLYFYEKKTDIWELL